MAKEMLAKYQCKMRNMASINGISFYSMAAGVMQYVIMKIMAISLSIINGVAIWRQSAGGMLMAAICNGWRGVMAYDQ
jgi:hypothetical protein